MLLMAGGTAILENQPASLWMQGFGAGYGDRVVLAEIDLELELQGLIALMGPVGVGKSTLLRTICGVNQQNASFKTWGEARYKGLLLGEAGWPSLVAQDARLLVSTVYENLAGALAERSRLTLAEQRRFIRRHIESMQCNWLTESFDVPVVELTLAEQRVVAILRQTLSETVLVCVDEPTVGLDDEGAETVLELLRSWSQEHAVLMASHHQKQVARHADRVVLLASGRIQEVATTRDFFRTPRSNAARQFVDRGTCLSLRPDARPEELAEDVQPPPPLPEQAHQVMSAWAGPRGFVWLEKGRLAGTPKPGVVNDLSQDLDALARVGVTRLLTLLETPLSCDRALADRGIVSVHVPIDDMDAPTMTQALGVCRQIDEWLDAGEVVAVHCLAGHGRTGTVLAAYRIWQGRSPLEAVEEVRKFEQRWIQSREQVRFLELFKEFLESG